MGRGVDGERGPTFVDTNAHEDTARQKTRQSPVIGLRFYYTLAHAGVPFPLSSSSLPAFPFFSSSHPLHRPSLSPPRFPRSVFAAASRVHGAFYDRGCDHGDRLRHPGSGSCIPSVPRGRKLCAVGNRGKKKERKKEQNNEYVFP